MLRLKGKNKGFSSVYKILTNQKIYKIYNKTAFSIYFRDRQSWGLCKAYVRTVYRHDTRAPSGSKLIELSYFNKIF